MSPGRLGTICGRGPPCRRLVRRRCWVRCRLSFRRVRAGREMPPRAMTVVAIQRRPPAPATSGSTKSSPMTRYESANSRAVRACHAGASRRKVPEGRRRWSSIRAARASSAGRQRSRKRSTQCFVRAISTVVMGMESGIHKRPDTDLSKSLRTRGRPARPSRGGGLEGAVPTRYCQPLASRLETP